MSDEVFCEELDKKSLIRLAVRYSFAKLLTMKLLTCKIECEKVKKIIDNITCPIWICGGSDTVEGCMGRGTERGCLSKVR